MENVSFAGYQAAKAEIIGGVEYKESSILEGKIIRKIYITEHNGEFHEINDGGRVEFWSSKHPESRIYDENRQADRLVSEEPPHYGDMLCEKIRATADTAHLSDFEKFVLDRGYEFETEGELKAGYDRLWKASHGILLTAEEFRAETKDAKAAEDLYRILSSLAAEKKLTAGDLYQYARFRWCLKDPCAVVAFQIGREKYQVNNCDEEIPEEAARIKVCEEFGFEASRIKIIGTPYYEATDWNFIRFNCAGWAWLMANGAIKQVYE